MKKFTLTHLSYKYILILVFVTLFFTSGLKAQNYWVEDREMNFKIKVPTIYQRHNLMDGTDKINVFVSPDQNLIIRVRSIPLSQQITDIQLQSIFEQNIINGALRISDESSDLNGLPARWSGYSWVYEGMNTVLVNYYLVRKEVAFIVWAIVPENMVGQKTAQMARIMGSFQLINGHPKKNDIAQNPKIIHKKSAGQNTWDIGREQHAQSTAQVEDDRKNNHSVFSGTQTSSTLTSSENQYKKISGSTPSPELNISAIYFGTRVDNNFQIIDPTASIPYSAKQIHTVFKYDGNTNDQNFQVKWFSQTLKSLVAEDTYLPRLNYQNIVYAYIENAGKPWPNGNYRTELWFAGRKISSRNFTIEHKTLPSAAKKQITPTDGTLLGKTFADGTGDNRTKRKGGKHLTIGLNKLKDGDELLIKINSGTLHFVHIHLRNRSGIWHDAYNGRDTKFKVKDLLKGKRNSYTHLIFNVNAKHERYLNTACSAEVWQLPESKSSPPIHQKSTGINRLENYGPLDGKYRFENRSDGKKLVENHYIFIRDDGLFDEKYQPIGTVDYFGGGGKWKKNGNRLIFNFDDGIVQQYTIKSGNRIARQSNDGVVFTFKKEQE